MRAFVLVSSPLIFNKASVSDFTFWCHSECQDNAFWQSMFCDFAVSRTVNQVVANKMNVNVPLK